MTAHNDFPFYGVRVKTGLNRRRARKVYICLFFSFSNQSEICSIVFFSFQFQHKLKTIHHSTISLATKDLYVYPFFSAAKLTSGRFKPCSGCFGGTILKLPFRSFLSCVKHKVCLKMGV